MNPEPGAEGTALADPEAGAYRVLVVDDEPGIREGCRRILSADGYRVETAENGEMGCRLFRPGRFDAVLVDLKMPGMDGIELTKRLHAEDPGLIILVITAYATIDTAVEVTKEGAYGYLPKPFAPSELLLCIKNALDRRALALETKRLREERERNLLEVAWERSKCHSIIQCMKDAVLAVNRQREVVLLNDSAARILPHTTEMDPPFALERLAPRELQELAQRALRAKRAPMVLSREIGIGDNTYMANVSPIREGPRDSAGIVAVLTDITALKRLEVAKSMFVTMVAHEVKSPLAAAEGYLKILLDGSLVADEEKKAQMMERSLVRISTLRNMVSELMNITAIETGNFTVQRTPCPIIGLVRKAIDSVREKSEAKRIPVRFTHAACEELDRVFVDEDATLVVFRNLLENAIKYTPEGGEVSVDVRPNGFFAQVAVKDTGIGLQKEDIQRIFGEFYRVKNDYTVNIAGTGLGLTLVKKLLDLQNGRIAVVSEPGRGSEFTVSLPLTRKTS